jgi:hypothetical protein
MKYPREWEEIDEDTDRLKTPNGWIVRSYLSGSSIHQVIINDPDHEWVLEDEEEE